MLPEQLQRIIGYFLEEATEHLHTIEQGLLNLQTTVEIPERAYQVIRAAHSVKGGAAMLGFGSIQRVAHRLEDYIQILRECPLTVESQLESLLLQIFETLRTLLGQVSVTFGLDRNAANQTMIEIEPVFDELNQYLRTLIPTRLTIRATADEQVHVLLGYCTSLVQFSETISEHISLLGGMISRQEHEGFNQRISLDIYLPARTPVESLRQALEGAGGVIGVVQTQRGFSLFSGTEYAVYQVPLERPKTCIGCRYYYGRNDGGYLLNCAIHPQGPEDENCRDREGE